jgi:hypothetical protein
MKPIHSTLIAVTLATAGMFATGHAGSRISKASIDMQMERLASRCEAGLAPACEHLVLVTNGRCAGPVGSGCRYTLETRKTD